MPVIWLFARDRLGWIIFAAHNWNVWVYFEYDDLNKKIDTSVDTMISILNFDNI